MLLLVFNTRRMNIDEEKNESKGIEFLPQT